MKRFSAPSGRRTLLRMLAGAPIATGLAMPALAGDKLTETPTLDMGTCYPVRKPQDQDADLTIIRGHHAHAVGDIVELSGRVMTPDGKAVPHAVLEVWQANHHGRYAHPADTNTAPLDPNFQGYALVRADAQGRYKLRTIKPGMYPASPSSTRAPHIHFDVRGREYRAILQMFFPGENQNDQDPVYVSLPETYREATVARLVGANGGVNHLEWDIVLMVG